MPGPVMRDMTPDWMKPENASVLDSPVIRAARILAGVLGANDPNAQAMGAANPMAMTLAPRVPAEQLLERFAPIDKASPAIRRAVEHLIQRFPRVMSHVSDINPSPLNAGSDIATADTVKMGRMATNLIAQMPRFAADAPYGQGMRAPVAMIQYDPQAVAGRELETLAHELTHVGQTVRQTDLARRIPTEPTFDDIYTRMTKAQGYRNNPMEVAARATADSVVSKAPTFAPRNVASRMWEAVSGDSAAVEKRLRQVFPNITDAQVMDAIKYARTR
jgi:hypothetical protein